MTIKFDDINTWGTVATFAGLIISIITLIVANNVRRVTETLQNSIAFDKRVPGHLKQIDLLLTKFNQLLNNVSGNINPMRALMAKIRSEISSLSTKISDKKTKRLFNKVIRGLDKNINRKYIHHSDLIGSTYLKKAINYFFTVSDDDYWQSYTSVGEIYSTIENLHKDKQVKIKS